MDIAVITSGFLPVPPSKGGAVENLLYNLIKYNEIEEKINFTIFSIYDKEAIKESKALLNTKFKFLKTNGFIKICDKIIFIIAKYILKRKNSQSYRFILQRLNYLNKVSKDLKKNNYDKILLENHPTQYLALKWRKNYIKYKDRYYYHCHNEFPGKYGCNEIINKTRSILCVSEYIKNALEKIDIPLEKMTVLRNGVDEQKFNNNIKESEKEKIRKKYNLKKDDIVLIYTGRIVPEKGVLELVKAFNLIKKEKIKLLIVGASLNAIKNKTIYEKDVEEEIRKNNNIIFTGFVKYDEIPKIYKISDIAILPSLWNDPAPLSVIESMRCGLAIITTNSGGIPEYTNINNTVFVKKDKEIINNIKNAINYLIVDEAKIEKMKINSIKASKTLTLQNYYSDFIEKIN